MLKSLLNRNGNTQFELVDFDTEFNNVFDLVNRSLDGIFKKDPFRVLSNRAAFPRTNIRQDEKDIVFEVAIPGYCPDDVEVLLKEGVLTVSCSKTHEEPSYIGQREFAHRAFSRSWAVDAPADSVSAHYHMGVLLVRIKDYVVKREQPDKGTSIPVQK